MKTFIRTISGGGETNGRFHNGVYEFNSAELQRQLKADLKKEVLRFVAMMIVFIGIAACLVTLLIVGE